MRIALHADGGSRVGLGHLGRCVALAQAFGEAGARPVFVDVPKECRPWLRARGFTAAALGSRRWDLVVGDSYRLSAAGWKRLRAAGKRLLVIDDLGTFSGECDFVLNGHADAPALRFDRALGASLLLGTKFFPLRSEYWMPRREKTAPRRVARAVVTLGAGEAGGLAERVARETARLLPRARVELVTGPLSGARTLPDGLKLLGPQRSLRPLFERADLVVCAGGQTLYEAAFCGAPALAIQLAPNQRGNVLGMSAAGAAAHPGLPSDHGFWPAFRSLVRALNASPARRAEMARRGREVVDGQGARRVARAVLS